MNPSIIKCPSCDVVNDVEMQGVFDYNHGDDCMTATRYQCQRCGHRFLERCKRSMFRFTSWATLPRQAQWGLNMSAFSQSALATALSSFNDTMKEVNQAAENAIKEQQNNGSSLYLSFLTGSDDNKWVGPQP